MRTDEQRSLLGRFIRSHRERTAPDQAVPRRRTPGLRREELAARAGIGVTWCAWIEQGRPVSVSPHALARLAVALHLTAAERAYLFELAGRRDPAAPAMPPNPAAPAGIATLVDALPFPAYGLDRLWNACGWNRAAEDLFAGWLGPAQPRNLLHFTFMSPSARSLLPDWEERARRLLAEFRADCARLLDDPDLQALVGQLRDASRLFADEWDAQSVSARLGGLRTFVHPRQGVLTFAQHTFTAAERPDHKLVTLVPHTGAA